MGYQRGRDQLLPMSRRSSGARDCVDAEHSRRARARLLAFADALIATVVPGLPAGRFVGYMPVISRGLQIVRDIVEERRQRPIENDLLNQLISACDEAERLSDAELCFAGCGSFDRWVGHDGALDDVCDARASASSRTTGAGAQRRAAFGRNASL